MRIDAGLLIGARARTQLEQARWAEHQRTLSPNADKAEVAREFEALMLEQMLRTMREATPKAELFGKSRGEKLFQEMLDGEYMRLFSRRGGIGLSDLLVQHMNKYQ